MAWHDVPSGAVEGLRRLTSHLGGPDLSPWLLILVLETQGRDEVNTPEKTKSTHEAQWDDIGSAFEETLPNAWYNIKGNLWMLRLEVAQIENQNS